MPAALADLGHPQTRHRRCASQQANVLWSILTLGLADGRTPDLVERLLHWSPWMRRSCCAARAG